MFSSKVVIVTGAASGIGYAISEKFYAEGAQVVMVDINASELSTAASKICGDIFVADLSKRKDCKNLVEYVVKTFGKVDILINCAGIQTIAPLEDFSEDRWDFMIHLMLTAPFLLTKYCWPYMKAQSWGRIINMNSIHGLVASEFKSAYVAAKHGLLGFTKAAALEGGSVGITVNSICPAYVRTPLVENQIEAQAVNHGINREDVINDIMLKNAVVKSLLDPNDIAELVKYLCSDVASNITGTSITIDGGWTAR